MLLNKNSRVQKFRSMGRGASLGTNLPFKRAVTYGSYYVLPAVPAFVALGMETVSKVADPLMMNCAAWF